MHCIPIFVIVCLLVITECDFKLLQHESRQKAELEHREQNNISTQTTLKPPCVKCVIPPKSELGELAKAIRDLRPVLKNVSELFGSVFKNILTSVKNTEFAIQISLSEMKVAIEPVLEGLSKSVANINNCPSLKALFDTLRHNMLAFLEVLDNSWPKLLSETDLDSLQDSLLDTLSNVVTTASPMNRDLSYYLLQIFSFHLCDSLGNGLYELLDPYGDLSKRLIELVRNASKSEAKIILQGLFKDVVPGQSQRTLNLFTIISQALCILESGLDLGEIGGSNCLNEPIGGSVHPWAAVKGLACSILDLLLTVPGLSSVSEIPLPRLPDVCTNESFNEMSNE